MLRRYLAIAPGARPHFPVEWQAPMSAFVPIADRYPVFRITHRVTSRQPAATEHCSHPALDQSVSRVLTATCA